MKNTPKKLKYIFIEEIVIEVKIYNLGKVI